MLLKISNSNKIFVESFKMEKINISLMSMYAINMQETIDIAK